MAKTINSAAAPYATSSDLMSYYDVNIIGDVLRDGQPRLTPDVIATDPLVMKLLLLSTGDIESWCVRARLYDPADLVALSASPTASGEKLRWLCCARTIQHACDRRVTTLEAVKVIGEAATQELRDLTDGKDVFALQELEVAGVPETHAVTESEWSQLNLLTSDVRYWGNIRPQSPMQRPFM